MPEGSTVVVDRGMAYAENLAEIRQRKHHYVIAARQPERDKWLDQFEEPRGLRVSAPPTFASESLPEEIRRPGQIGPPR